MTTIDIMAAAEAVSEIADRVRMEAEIMAGSRDMPIRLGTVT